MALRTEELSALIKDQIRHYDEKLESKDVGYVITVGDGIALVQGLENALAGELLKFPGDVYGMVMNLEEEHVGVVLLGDDRNISEGNEVVRTGRIVEVPVGDALLGRVVNALGVPIDGGRPIQTFKTRPIERVAPGVITRKSVNEPVQTGLKVIDAIVPIGRGQRELIIGDRQTVKTALAIDTILHQKKENMYCIYVAIGQKASTVAQIVQKLKEAGAMEYTTVVVSSASETAPLQYIAPYAGCAMGEEWMEEGKDVLIIYDDLSKHAVAYRTLSLLLRRPSGREAYPGDVFYLHSRLLERSAKLAPEYGGGSLTALPIIETQAGDITAYIPTNVISITDGQIFLQTDLFNAGIRPAVDTGLSVSRVGGSAQIKAMKKVAGSLKLELAQYHEMQSFAQFGSDLDASTQRIIDHGKRLERLLVQPQYAPMDVENEVTVLLSAKKRQLDRVPLDQVSSYERQLISHMNSEHRDLLEELLDKKDLTKELDEKLTEAIRLFTDRFVMGTEEA